MTVTDDYIKHEAMLLLSARVWHIIIILFIYIMCVCVHVYVELFIYYLNIFSLLRIDWPVYVNLINISHTQTQMSMSFKSFTCIIVYKRRIHWSCTNVYVQVTVYTEKKKWRLTFVCKKVWRYFFFFLFFLCYHKSF